MPNIEEIKEKYLSDADDSGHKSKFGFFSLPPSATAGFNPYQKKSVEKDDNGRVKTQERNIYSGITASGTLKKSYFNYEPSVFQGDLYTEPEKRQQKEKYEEAKRLEGKQVYKPLSLSKTPKPQAAYQYIPDQPKTKKVKDITDSNGKVITEERNIYTNPQSKIEKEKIKEIKHIHDPYQNYLKLEKEQQMKSIKLRGEGPFKSSSSAIECFTPAREIFGGELKGEKKQLKIFNASAQHDSNFKPSGKKKSELFSYPQYKPSGYDNSAPKQKLVTERQQQFKPVKQPNKFKPCPSISTMKSNLLRSIR